MEKLTIIMCRYHRNGITGVGFFAMNFSYIEDGVKHYAIGTVSSEDFTKYRENPKEFLNCETRILMYSPTGGVDLANPMRGDYFHNDLCEWLKRNPEKRIEYSAK